MNELEWEYQANLHRMKMRENRRRRIALGLASAAFVAGAILTFVFEGFTPHAFLQAAWSLSLPGLLGCLWLATRFQTWFEERHVEVTSTERERAYRVAPPIAQARPSRVSRARHVIATAPLALVIVAYVVRRLSWGNVDDVPESLAITAVLGTLLGIGVLARHVYEAWRARRNARLELQWEKWLDSADSCEVGPRKWTK